MKRLRGYFVAGILVVVPIGVTVFIFWWVFKTLDDFLQPIMAATIGYEIPGLSIALTFLLIFIIGASVKIAIGRKIIYIVEKYIEKIPLGREIYGATKQITSAIFVREEGYDQVVLVEYPRKGLYALGLITGTELEEVQMKTEKDVISVYIPTSPNPTSGYMVFASREELIPLEMEVDDVIKLLISGGFMAPQDKLEEEN